MTSLIFYRFPQLATGNEVRCAVDGPRHLVFGERRPPSLRPCLSAGYPERIKSIAEERVRDRFAIDIDTTCDGVGPFSRRLCRRHVLRTDRDATAD